MHIQIFCEINPQHACCASPLPLHSVRMTTWGRGLSALSTAGSEARPHVAGVAGGGGGTRGVAAGAGADRWVSGQILC